MDVRLVLEKGTKPQTWRLHHKDNVVGRRSDCQLRILSAEVSRRHCLLSIDDGYVKVEDFDSINGTFINGRRVVGKQVLRPGDHLEIGPLEFIVEYDLTPSAVERLAQQAAANAAVDAEIEVLPLAEEGVEANAAAAVERSSTPAADEEVIDDDEAANWHLPQTNDLRDLLSQVEQPESGPRRRKR